MVGSINVDQTVDCDRVPQEGETLFGTSFSQSFGGKGANQAVMAALLGADVRFVGQVGDDDLGAAAIANLQQHGIDTSGVGRSEVATGVASIWVEANGANRILVVPGANGTLDADGAAQRLSTIPSPSVVVAQLEVPIGAVRAAFAQARQSRAITILNPAPASEVPEQVLADTDWLIPNETEFAILTGEEVSQDAARNFAERWECGVIVTLGADGAIVAEPGKDTTRLSAPPVEVVDTTGAGDAFVGAFAVGLSSGLHPVAAAELGVRCGSSAVTKHGTQSSYPTADDL